MHRILNKAQKGFTLIELMIVVAIIGILAAVAIPQFLQMMNKSKSSEAQLTLDLIKKGNKAQWAESTGFVPSTAATLPASGSSAGCCGVTTAQKCTADPDDWNADTVWSALDVRVDQDGYFVYDYDGTDGSAMTALAYGDVNCNGSAGEYALIGDKDASGGPEFAMAKPGQTATTPAGMTITTPAD